MRSGIVQFIYRCEPYKWGILSWRHTPNELWCAVYMLFEIMKYINFMKPKPSYIIIPLYNYSKIRNLRASVYNVDRNQNELVEHVTRVSILRIRRLWQNRPQRLNTVFAVARIIQGGPEKNGTAYFPQYVDAATENGGLSRGTYPICIHMEVPPPPPPGQFGISKCPNDPMYHRLSNMDMSF